MHRWAINIFIIIFVLHYYCISITAPSLWRRENSTDIRTLHCSSQPLLWYIQAVSRGRRAKQSTTIIEHIIGSWLSKQIKSIAGDTHETLLEIRQACNFYVRCFHVQRATFLLIGPLFYHIGGLLAPLLVSIMNMIRFFCIKSCNFLREKLWISEFKLGFG